MKRHTLGMFLAALALTTTAGCKSTEAPDMAPSNMAPPDMAQSDMDQPDQAAALQTLTLQPTGNGTGSVVSTPPGPSSTSRSTRAG